MFLFFLMCLSSVKYVQNLTFRDSGRIVFFQKRGALYKKKTNTKERSCFFVVVKFIVFCCVVELKCVADGVYDFEWNLKMSVLLQSVLNYAPKKVYKFIKRKKYIPCYFCSMLSLPKFYSFFLLVMIKEKYKFNGKLCTLWACLVG